MALYSTKRNRIPITGNPGDVWYATDSGESFLACSDGTLLDLHGLLRGNVLRIPAAGPPGERGERGHQGERGQPGKDGKDGADSQVPGPQGVQGVRGRDGRDGVDGKNGKDGKHGVDGKPGRDGRDGKPGPAGDVLTVGPDELKAAVETARQQLLARRAAVLAAIHQARIDSGRLTAGVRAVLHNALRDVEKANA